MPHQFPFPSTTKLHARKQTRPANPHAFYYIDTVTMETEWKFGGNQAESKGRPDEIEERVGEAAYGQSPAGLSPLRRLRKQITHRAALTDPFFLHGRRSYPSRQGSATASSENHVDDIETKVESMHAELT